MPTEDRRIIFTPDEVYKSLYSFCTQKQIPKPPPGQLVHIVQDEADDSRIYFTAEDSVSKTKEKFEHSKDFVAAALLLFCRGLGIPIAKSGKKSVLVKDGRVMLRVTID